MKPSFWPTSRPQAGPCTPLIELYWSKRNRLSSVLGGRLALTGYRCTKGNRILYCKLCKVYRERWYYGGTVTVRSGTQNRELLRESNLVADTRTLGPPTPHSTIPYRDNYAYGPFSPPWPAIVTVFPSLHRATRADPTSSMLETPYTAQSSSMHQESSHEIHAEVLNIKKEVISWQSEALRGQEVNWLFHIDLCTELTLLRQWSENSKSSNPSVHSQSNSSP
jgi:hypothetical protein